MKFFACVLLASVPMCLAAQEKNPTQSSDQQNAPGGPNPIFRVQAVSRSIQAVSYRHRSGFTRVDFQGTSLAPKAKGKAEVNNRLGAAQIKLEVKNLPAPTQYGAEFLTYVLWAITPDGHPQNLGEVVIDSNGNYSNDNLSTNLQAFGLIITAEPYFAVRMPSDVVVMQNIIRQDTLGKEELIDAKYELLPRGQYVYNTPSSEQKPVNLSNKKNPLELYEAQNAIQIARYAKADQFSDGSFDDAVKLLSQAEDYQTRKQWKPAIMTAREAVQKAEDARTVSLRKQQQLALDKERSDAAARVAAAREKAAQEAAAAEAAAKLAQQESEQRAAAEQARKEADAAREQAALEAQKAQAAAAEADRLRAQAVADKNALRQQLLQQFNSVLQTRETARGLVINMSDVLFATGKYDLKSETREKLARLSGIILSHPGLNLHVEGYTDITGSDALNQKLSEQRASTVREYMISQGIAPDAVSSMGYGKAYPVASNDTAAGRAMNRRVEMVVSGEVIGVQIGVPPSAGQGAAPGGPTAQTAPASPAAPAAVNPQ
jgi:outer membrane protein OmpA-like peptidoglycan-associated protein